MEDSLKKLRELTDRLPFMGYHPTETKLRVLIVEDEKSISRLIFDTLEYFGCNCMASISGDDAINKINDHDFDVLLANIILKETGEGARVIKIFQQKFPSSVVIIMSGTEERLPVYSKYFQTLAMPFGIYDLVKKITDAVIVKADIDG